MAGKIYLTPLYRAAWADMMAGDARLTPIAVRVGLVIGGFFNSGSADTYVAQPTIAKHMDICERTVWESVQELIALGYLEMTRGRGRKSSTYRMPVERVAEYCKKYNAKSRNELRDYDDLSRATLRDNGDFVPQNSALVPQNSARSPATDCEQTLSTNSKINSTSNVAAFEPHERLWRSVIERVTARLGADIVENWIVKLSIIGISEGECRLAAPTKFIETWCRTNFADVLQEAFKECQPTIDRVCIEVRQAHARGTGQSQASGGAA